ncbi:hypothetical protein KGF54_001783 [Candida jiufengensis]|uniref:uncharacterized protein n=1 Tax=Candida jiufengensis TaxID=497108 RepID=UPI00222526D2|nr:uncharacterized protein KGF54_001783 [Candida jiufengensis]KAI5955222.1 hypothetical protein KGF54_001783 [Candida jiufengensis]
MTKISKDIINNWSNLIRQKVFKFKDTNSIGPQSNLLTLLNQILKITTDKYEISSKNWFNGFNFLFCNQDNVNVGSDGYDNYQAPVDSNNHQLFLRRLWVKGDLNFLQPSPPINSSLECIEKIKNVRFINENVFVQIERKFYELLKINGNNEKSSEDNLKLIENRVMMYTNQLYHQSPPPTEDSKISIKSDEKISIKFKISPIDLLKYSMLTYNLHKIHYDFKYAHSIENLPALLVHGPLQITLLLYYFQHKYPNLTPKNFTYRTFQPCFCGDEVGIVIEKLSSEVGVKKLINQFEQKKEDGETEEEVFFELSLINVETGKAYMRGKLIC